MTTPDIGTIRRHAPLMNNQDAIGSPPAYPAAQGALADTSIPVQALTSGARTLLPLADGSTKAFSDYAATRVDVTNKLIKAVMPNELTMLRITFKVVQDDSLTALVLAGLMSAVTIGPFSLKMLAATSIYLEADIGGTVGVIYADTKVITHLPCVVGLTFPVYGGATFQANGCKIYGTTTGAGLKLTDPRVLVVQER
jgi:hypothetical protein